MLTYLVLAPNEELAVENEEDDGVGEEPVGKFESCGTGTTGWFGGGKMFLEKVLSQLTMLFSFLRQ